MFMLSLRLAVSSLATKPLSRVFALASTAFVLFVSALVFLLLQSFSGALSDVRDAYFLTAYLDGSSAGSREREATAEIREVPGVMSATLVSKDAFVENFSKFFPQLARDLTSLDSDAIPRYVKVKVAAGSEEEVKLALKAVRGVESVDVNRQRFGGLISALVTLKRFALLLLAGSVAALLCILLNHFKLDTLHRSQVMSTLRLLGASGSQMYLPFALEGVLEGLLGGVAAAALLFSTGSVFDAQVGRLFSALGYQFRSVALASVVGWIVACGVLSGLAVSVWAASSREGGGK